MAGIRRELTAPFAIIVGRRRSAPGSLDIGTSDTIIGTVDVLSRIKRLAVARRIVLTRKAEEEMDADGLSEDEVIESIVNARRIAKVIRSTRRGASAPVEKLYVIKGLTFANVLVYTKGKIVRDAGQETFYILISSKRAT